jgi:hypothetical protein
MQLVMSAWAAASACLTGNQGKPIQAWVPTPRATRTRRSGQADRPTQPP